MKEGRKSLTKQLTLTILILSAAMLAVWFLFYVNIRNSLKRYNTRNMEQISEQILSDMERSFLQLEEANLVLSKDSSVLELFREEDYLEFVRKAGEIENNVSVLSKNTPFMDNVIMYGQKDYYYRVTGKIDNTGIKRLARIIDKNQLNSHIQIHLDDENYIGYATPVMVDGKQVGTIVMLTDEKAILRLFERMSDKESVTIALSAEGEIILSNDSINIGKTIESIRKSSNNYVYKQVGFTTFELIVSYDDSNPQMRKIFFVAMIIVALLLLLLLEVFLQFWRKKFFMPIESVISDVEEFEVGNGEMISPTGLEHFDGLVSGINDMIERIEQKEKEVYQTAYSLQESELRKQKALIVSLKKQISAHFTVNVLNIIKALSSNGDNEKAGLLCDGLSFLLRYANAGDSYVDAMEEFFVLEKYAEIMNIRYPSRFEINIDIEDDLENITLPRMLIQPIVENSILHGAVAAGASEIKMIHVYAEIFEEDVNFVVEDNGCGMTESQLAEIVENLANIDFNDVEVAGLSHVALLNIQRRIVSYYGKNYGISLESSPDNGTRVVVKLPKNKRI